MPTPAAPGPPVARRAPTVAVVHGERREDGYAWLRAKDDPEVRAYLEAENAYTDRAMAPTAAFQGALYQEMLARIKEDDATVPVPFGGFSYYSRTEQGKQYPIYCRRAGSPEAPRTVPAPLAAFSHYSRTQQGRRYPPNSPRAPSPEPPQQLPLDLRR